MVYQELKFGSHLINACVNKTFFCISDENCSGDFFWNFYKSNAVNIFAINFFSHNFTIAI
ncbi:hypothetical protein SMM_0551 [Spiroplasma mirum ATCC 29335]|nr:hypothetical protein SMM_0551 [Spiroplasma mirum ATCC 29335]